MALPYQKFNGKIDGKTIYDFTKQLDYSEDLTQKDRIKLVYDILYKDGYIDKFFEDFFSYYYNPHLTKEDCLSHQHNVFQELDKMANYILYSPDGERITKKTKYNFYTENRFQKELHKELSIDKMVEDVEEMSEDEIDTNVYDEVIDFLIRKGENYKKSKKQKITKKDLKDKELKCVQEYQDYINYAKIELDRLREEGKDYPKQKRLARILKEVKKDQLLAKDLIKGTIYFKDVLPDTTEIDYDQFDFFDKEHVMALLKCPPIEDLLSDKGCLIYDLNRLLEKCNLSPADWEILRLYREEDLSLTDIANKLNVKQPFVSATLNKICNKIIDVYEAIYEDWYYLNIVKGKYKKCSKCGEIKIANERNFGKHPNTKDGLQSICKICDNSRKNI